MDRQVRDRSGDRPHTSFESTVAILASGTGYADALPAAGIAGAYKAPLLLTNPTSLSSVVGVQLVEMGVKKVIIVGGTPAVSSGVAVRSPTAVSSSSAFRALTATRRLQPVANRVRTLMGPTDAFVVRG